MSEPMVELVDVGKQYVKYEDTPMLTSQLKLWGRTKRSRLWAVRHVDLAVDRGETMGVIGRNGAGKSTMLRMLAGVTGPTEGVVRVRGKVAPLIAVGVGFHPELTGQENVYVNGNVLGMSRDEIDRRFDAIVDFSEIGDFIDTPVKFYSSGMFVRLGFAVAVAADPEVLLVDEVLAVGDFKFQAKCFARMEQLRERGTTILVVSHNLNAVRHLCDRTLLLNAGQPVFVGDTDEALGRFHSLLDDTDASDPASAGVGPVEAQLLDGAGRATNHLRSGDTANLVVSTTARRDLDRVTIGVILSQDDHVIYADSDLHQRESRPRTAAAGEPVSCTVRIPMHLPSGTYSVRAVATWDERRDDRRPSPAIEFFVSGRPFVQGVADLRAEFGSDDADVPTGVDGTGGGSSRRSEG